uniref:mitogen-activated protein kinase n=1 Tax=Angiostrongylus cantonensis TaxID=6313 RepID=A0A158P8D4_ANGCA
MEPLEAGNAGVVMAMITVLPVHMYIDAPCSEPITVPPVEPVGTAATKPVQIPIQRRFNYVPVNTVNFALPEGYSTSRSDIEFLGSGAYGNVIKTIVECRDGVVRAVAVKKFRDPFCDSLQARMIYREIKLLQIMRHDSVIRAIDLYTPDNVEHEFKDVYVVTEFAGDSIVRILHDQKVTGRTHITHEHVPFIIYQLLRALKYIHSANIIHRDLKPGNMALTSDSDLTVLDFGMARSLNRSERTLTQYVMTRWYRSPEVIYWNIDGYNEQVDLWSVGCITAELMFGEPLFPGEDSNAQYEMITKLCGSPDEDLMRKIEATSPATRRVVESYKQYKRQDFRQRFSGYPPLFVDFLDKILVLDPEKRLTVDSSLAHPYFADYVDASDEPVATTSFDLNDNPSRSKDEWKGIIWQEIQNFVGDEISPKIPSNGEC